MFWVDFRFLNKNKNEINSFYEHIFDIIRGDTTANSV